MKQRTLTGASIECYPPQWLYFRDPEYYAKQLESWANEFNEFVRDHRSRDDVQLSIEREYEDRCSFCHRIWEEDDEGPVCCEAAQEEFRAAQAKAAQ